MRAIARPGRLTARSSDAPTMMASAIAAAQSASVVVRRGYAKGWCRTSDLYPYAARWRLGIVEP